MATSPGCQCLPRGAALAIRCGDPGRSAGPGQEEHQTRCVKLRRVSFPAFGGRSTFPPWGRRIELATLHVTQGFA